MKIGLISREYPPLTHVGGIGTYSAMAAEILAERGHEVHVVCNGPSAQVESSGTLHIHRVPMGNHPLPTGRLAYPYRALFRRHLPHYLDALTWARTAAAYLRGSLDAGSFDLWEYPETNGEGAFLSLPRGPRTVCRIHTSWLDAYAANRLEARLLLRLQKLACERAGKVVSPSQHMAGTYARDTLGLRVPVTVNRNPLKLWAEPVDWAAKDMRHLLFVGRVERRKGLHVLLRALDSLGNDAEGLTLRVVGHIHRPPAGPDRDCVEHFEAELARRSAQAGGRGYALEYAGPCGHAELHRHYDWAGILVLPSLMDNYPYVALEGLSRGCHLLGSDVGGIPEIIDRQARGSLFQTENSTQLAGKIRECRRRDREIPDSLRGNAADIREEFSPDACYRRLMEAYGANLSRQVRA